MPLPSINAIAFTALAVGAVALYFHQVPPPPAPPPPGPPQAAWVVPDPDTLPDDANGRLVRRGRDLITRTPALIGPDAPDPAMRFSGNGLACASCHLQAGTQRYALPLAGVAAVFPTYIARENEVRTLAQRIDGCMERSMNGRAMPPDGPEMRAMLAYMAFIGARPAVPGRGAPDLPWPDRAADPVHGKAVFASVCAACHGADGLGQRLGPTEAAQLGKRYQFPPLWGPESYNDGAGMARVITAAKFVRANMPVGASWDSPQITPEQAYDVMAFVNSQPRPRRAGLEHDYPDRAKKAVDAAYAPYMGPFPAEQHRYGPWQPIQAWLKEHGAEARTAD